MLIAYFDESGHAASEDFVAIAAYVADEKVWAKFDIAWNAVLQKHGAPYLHAVELAHMRKTFKGWTGEQQRGLSADLMNVIQMSGLTVAAGAVLSTRDFRSLTKEQQGRLLNPFFPLFQEVVRGASLNALFDAPELKVKMIFSQQDEFSGLAKKLYDVMARTIDTKDRLGRLEFQNMRRVPGLQAADVLAYELCRYYKDKAKNPTKPMRWPLRQILIPQTVYGAAFIRFIPLWRLRLQLQPPWIFKFVTIVTGWAVAIPAYFYPVIWSWAMGAPILPREDRKRLRKFEREYRQEKASRTR
jgi:hypothetical protein